MYDPDDIITVGCQPKEQTAPDLQPRLYWVVDGKEVTFYLMVG